MSGRTNNTAQRTPPHSIEAEQAVLGGLLLKPQALDQISDWLGDSDFYRRDHQVIFRGIAELAAKQHAADAVTLGEWFEAQGTAETVGGARYIIELANSTPSAANIVAYAEIVREKSKLRQVIDVGTSLAGRGYEPNSADASLIIAEAQSKLAELGTAADRGGLVPTGKTLKTWFAGILQRYEAGHRVTGLETPWFGLNEVTHGLQRGHLIVLAGRPEMGKTICGAQLAAFSALRGKRVAFFSLEMAADEILQRAIACIGEVPHDWLLVPDDSDYWAAVNAAVEQLKAAPLLIDDQPGLTVRQIVARAKREHMRHPLGAIVVDHLHIVRRPNQRSEVGELGDVSRELKGLAKDLGVPVIALAQLNRAVVGRPNRRPTMADLRASGEIEQDADLVLLLHREDYYEPDTHLRGLVELIVAKGRNIASGGTVHLRNRYDQMRLEDWQGQLPQAPAAVQSERGFASRYSQRAGA